MQNLLEFFLLVCNRFCGGFCCCWFWFCCFFLSPTTFQKAMYRLYMGLFGLTGITSTWWYGVTTMGPKGLQRITKMSKGLKHLLYVERLREQWLFNHWIIEEEAQGHFVSVYSLLIATNEDKGARLFLVVPTDGAGSNGHKWKNIEFNLNTRKRFFNLTVSKHWHRLPREKWTWFWRTGFRLRWSQ